MSPTQTGYEDIYERLTTLSWEPIMNLGVGTNRREEQLKDALAQSRTLERSRQVEKDMEIRLLIEGALSSYQQVLTLRQQKGVWGYDREQIRKVATTALVTAIVTIEEAMRDARTETNHA